MSSFPHRFRDRCIEAGYSPTVVAQELGVAPQSVGRWLSGRGLPAPELAMKLSALLDDNNHSMIRAYMRQFYSRIVAQARKPESIEPYRLDIALDAAFRRMPIARMSHLELTFLLDHLGRLRGLQEEQEQFQAHETAGAQQSLIILPSQSIQLVDNWPELLSDIARGTLKLESLQWKSFEDLVARILRDNGWNVTQMGYTKDDGVDIMAVQRLTPDVPIHMLVQCKKYARDRKVGIDVVREVWSVKWEKGAHQAMIATTSSFTRGARAKAEQWRLSLADHDAILDWCKTYGESIDN